MGRSPLKMHMPEHISYLTTAEGYFEPLQYISRLSWGIASLHAYGPCSIPSILAKDSLLAGDVKDLAVFHTTSGSNFVAASGLWRIMGIVLWSRHKMP